MDTSKCFVCEESFKSILGHLAKASRCNNEYPPQLLNELRSKSQRSYAKKHTVYMKNTYDSAKERKRKQSHYDSSKETKRKRTQYHEEKHVRKEIMQSFNPSAPNYKTFFKEIQFGPIFPCICCMKCFTDRGVKVLDKHIYKKLTDANKLDCIDTSINLKVNDNFHLCHTCHLKLSKGKMPKLCFQNGLKLSKIPDCMQLSSLGNQLLAKYILFLKLREHNKSGYGILNDRVSYQYL